MVTGVFGIGNPLVSTGSTGASARAKSLSSCGRDGLAAFVRRRVRFLGKVRWAVVLAKSTVNNRCCSVSVQVCIEARIVTHHSMIRGQVSWIGTNPNLLRRTTPDETEVNRFGWFLIEEKNKPWYEEEEECDSSSLFCVPGEKKFCQVSD